MGKLFKNLKPYWKSVLVIFVLGIKDKILLLFS